MWTNVALLGCAIVAYVGARHTRRGRLLCGYIRIVARRLKRRAPTPSCGSKRAVGFKDEETTPASSDDDDEGLPPFDDTAVKVHCE